MDQLLDEVFSKEKTGSGPYQRARAVDGYADDLEESRLSYGHCSVDQVTVAHIREGSWFADGIWECFVGGGSIGTNRRRRDHS